jgi:formate dehydrogenase major subunit
MTHREEGIMKYTPSDFVEIHPETAAACGVESGDPVRVTSRRGEIVVPAQVTDRVGPDNVFVPIHFAESAVNRLTDEEHLDPAAATPEFKVSAVRVEAHDGDLPGDPERDVDASRTGDPGLEGSTGDD